MQGQGQKQDAWRGLCPQPEACDYFSEKPCICSEFSRTQNMGPFSNLFNNRQIPWHLLSLSSWNKGTQLKGHHWGIHRKRKKPLIKSMPCCPGLVCDLLQQKNPSSHPARSSPRHCPMPEDFPAIPSPILYPLRDLWVCPSPPDLLWTAVSLAAKPCRKNY